VHKMFRFFKNMLIIFFLLFLQTEGARLTGLYYLFPDFILLYLILNSRGRNRIQWMFTGFSAGLVQDLVAGSLVGTWALAKTLVCFISPELNIDDNNESGSIVKLIIPVAVHSAVLFIVNNMLLPASPMLFLEVFLPIFLVNTSIVFLIDIVVNLYKIRQEAF